MASFAERNRENVIRQLQKDERVGGDQVLSVAPLMRVSVMMLVVSGMIGVLLFQMVFGFGGLQFGIGLILGYAAYVAYVMATMGQPKVLGAMAVLTNKRLLLLGSRRVGIAAEWNIRDLANLEMTRKGNLLVMGKMSITPKGEEPLRFFLSNRRMGLHFFETYSGMKK